MKGFLTLDDIDVKGLSVLLRVDLNVPYNSHTRLISDSERVKAHANTIRELSDRNAKVVGFTTCLPSVAGRVMEQEIASCEKALAPEKPNMFILGGAKPRDCLTVMEHMFERQVLDRVLTCGLLENLFLKANGFNLGSSTLDLLKKRFLKSNFYC